MNEVVPEPRDEDAWWKTGAVEIGHDHWVEPIHLDEQEIGFIVAHRKPDGEMCFGTVYYRHREPSKHPIWTLESREPLTLSPSIACSCGDHGFIREGKWIPA